MNPFGLPPFDPSKMDPKLLMELSELIRSLPPDQLNKIQLLMHNMSAGFDVRKEMEEFEKSLPPGFREKLMAIMAKQAAAPAAEVKLAESTSGPSEIELKDMNLREARLTILRAVSEGRVGPDEAERLLFGND